MDKEELKGLQFVLRYYSPGVFDTRKAIRRYKETHQVIERTWLRYISWIAASVVVCLFTAYYLIGEKGSPVCLYSYADTTTFILPDSSEVTLFPNSTLSYLPDKFNKNKREVDMTGRIGFDVRLNQHTPFIVSGKYAKISGYLVLGHGNSGKKRYLVFVSDGKEDMLGFMMVSLLHLKMENLTISSTVIGDGVAIKMATISVKPLILMQVPQSMIHLTNNQVKLQTINITLNIQS